MKLNKKALQRQLDLSAQELDGKGYRDLSDSVDGISNELMSTDMEGVPALREQLETVSVESDRRDGKAPSEENRALARAKVKAKLAALKKGSKSLRANRETRLSQTADPKTALKLGQLEKRVAHLENLLK